MAFATALLTNGVEVKKAPIGFSWTTFFFGGFVGLFRQDWLWGVLMIIGCMLTYGLAGIVGAFIYNKVYIKALLKKGWKVQALVGTTDQYVANYVGFVSLPKTDDYKSN